MVLSFKSGPQETAEKPSFAGLLNQSETIQWICKCAAPDFLQKTLRFIDLNYTREAFGSNEQNFILFLGSMNFIETLLPFLNFQIETKAES